MSKSAIRLFGSIAAYHDVANAEREDAVVANPRTVNDVRERLVIAQPREDRVHAGLTAFSLPRKTHEFTLHR